MHNDNWDDIRFVLAVARDGSVSAAARRLGVNHATVLRRIAAFEERYSVQVFDKTPNGYKIPTDKVQIIDASQSVEKAILALERIIEGSQAPLKGTIRLTSTDTLCLTVLPPVVAKMRTEIPEVDVELISSNAQLDLARLDADVTVRPTAQLPDDLVGEKVVELGLAIYKAKGASESWLGLSGAMAESISGKWLADQAGSSGFVAMADSFSSLAELAKLGLGKALLPCVLGDSTERLVRDRPGVLEMSVPIWVASHVDLAEVPRIKRSRNVICRELRAMSGMISGA